MLARDGLGRRLIVPVGALIGLVLSGAVGYYLLGGGLWSFADCLYMTIITLTTVGYGEVLEGMVFVPWAREFTTVLIIVGMVFFLYLVSRVTATIVEGELRRALRKARMRKRIAKLDRHVVVCGTGSTGRHVVEELIAADRSCVAIDLDAERLESLATRWGEQRVHYIVGDATEDAVLQAANVANASGVVASLPNDKDNLFLVVSVRQANPRARIVARGSDLAVLEKLKKAGADTVVSPNYIGGMRMVSELIRPHVVSFIDGMLRDRDGKWRIEEMTVPAGSWVEGKTLREANFRGLYDVAVLASRDAFGEYTFNPTAEFRIASEMTLVVLGRLDRVNAMREQITG